MRVSFFIGIAALLCSPATAQNTASAPPVTAPAHIAAVQHVTLTTAQGAIIIAVEIERAPVSAANFLRYVDARRLDGVTFYRAMDLGRGYGLIQGGTQGNPRTTFPAIAHEPTSRTGLSHTDGAISFARLAPGTASGDFFITVGALTSLDAQAPGSGGDTDGFAVFGHVVQGMDVVRAILAAPTDPNAGAGVMRGQMIAAPVRIVRARRSVAPVVGAAVVAPSPAP